MKKFTWGHGITVFLIIFISTLIFVLIQSRRVDHSLVAEDYYAHDLAFQERYDKKSRQRSSDNVDIDYHEDSKLISLSFKDDPKSISGTMTLYRPSDAEKDLNVAINMAHQDHDISMLEPGNWVVIIDWVQDGVSFYKEEKIYL